MEKKCKGSFNILHDGWGGRIKRNNKTWILCLNPAYVCPLKEYVQSYPWSYMWFPYCKQAKDPFYRKSCYISTILMKLLQGALQKKNTIHLVTTMLVISKNALFPGHNHLLTTGSDDPSLAGSWALINVSSHQYWWLRLWPGNSTFL